MTYRSLKHCVDDLEKNGHLIRIKEEVDPNLEMAAIHLKVFAKQGPAILFESVKGSPYMALSNLFGNIERTRFIFRDTLSKMQNLVQLRINPMAALKNPFRYAATGISALKALPKKSGFESGGFKEIKISDLPLIKHWPEDGGAFVTLPQVYSEDVEKPGVMNSNLGMYRIQLNGNDYVLNKEIGLHYQIHRGIGIHQSKSNQKNLPLKVSIFVGGPPAHTLAAVMPLPEGLTELTFAGALGGRRFKYAYKDGYCISLDADFVITGEIHPGDVKPEGPFGDHLGYYSLKHLFPVMRIHKVFAKEKAIWPFTVVGRPPQEDTAFGDLIHEISGKAIPHEIPGVKEIHAVDAAGVHPLLLAVGSERYTPFEKNKRPAEILTQANRILGTGQLSLAKYLFIAANNSEGLSCSDVGKFMNHVFERVDLSRDLHFQTKTTIDTLDYSGEGLNSGSKLVVAAGTEKLRTLAAEIPSAVLNCKLTSEPMLFMNGVVGLKYKPFSDYESAQKEMNDLTAYLKLNLKELAGVVQIVIHDHNDNFKSNDLLRDYLWLTYTRSNPSHDIYGINEIITFKHWGCEGAMLIDARKKPHHAPELKNDPATEKKIEHFFKKGGILERWA